MKYQEWKKETGRLVAMAGCTVKKFNELLPYFHCQCSIVLWCVLFMATLSCGKKDPVVPDVPDEELPVVWGTDTSTEVRLTSFRFGKAYNVQLPADVVCDIDGGEITAFIPSLKSAASLIPLFEGHYETVKVDGVTQVSGVTPNDFDRRATYVLTGKNGATQSYHVTVKVFTGLPIVTITTDGAQPVADKETWVPGTVAVGRTPDYPIGYNGRMKMKGRGNATWTYEKKPYRFKLDAKAKILGMPADKDWVLLADYCDKSMLRTSCGFELAELAGLPWTPRRQHVEFFMNGAYQGTYLLCEHVKTAGDRANVQEDGFLFERDNYWNQEPLWFTTNRGHHYTFKYPDTEDIAKNDANYLFILKRMNDFENDLYSAHFTDPTTGYRKHIDVENFIRWYLVQETLGNIDTNPYFALESRTGKLKVYPVWDFEWSLGLAAIGQSGWAQPPTVSPIDRLYWRNSPYYDRLFQDPYFVNLFMERQMQMKTEWLPALEEKMANLREELRYAQTENFTRWPILGRYISVGLVKFPTWEEECDYALNFLKQRAEAIMNN
ncbi:MAG: CotH kinase family protein [Bacteroidales bacterium]|jgi:hypothetical protein|nr:CotH kinase family protein [Bacteroidales bacterium]